jgi:hypothetical protein
MESSILDREFSKATFKVCISLPNLDKVLIDKPVAFIKATQYYHRREPVDKIFMCKNESGSITARDLVNCLIKNKYCHNPYECRFLETFTVDDDGVVIPFFGS